MFGLQAANGLLVKKRLINLDHHSGGGGHQSTRDAQQIVLLDGRSPWTAITAKNNQIENHHS